MQRKLLRRPYRWSERKSVNIFDLCCLRMHRVASMLKSWLMSYNQFLRKWSFLTLD